MRKFYRFLRVLSAITLFFFCWTFLPIWQIAVWAAEPQGLRAGSRPDKIGAKGPGFADPSQSPLGKGGGRGVGKTSGERFEKALEAIRENVDRLEKKHALSGVERADKGEDGARERGIIKTKRAEIESADSEFKKEFAATEKKLKDAKLPQEILDRHYKFVKHYEDNLKELKTNLDAVGQYTADSKQGKDAIRKAKQHLEKTRTPSKHVPLDPNKLPHRMVKGKERAPRLKKEEFERDFPRQKKPAGLRSAEFTPLYSPLAKGGHGGWAKHVLLAYNSTIASDMPLELPLPEDKASTSEFPLSTIGRGAGVRAGESVGSVPELLNRGMRGSLDTPHWDNSLPDFVFSDSNPQSEIRNSLLMLAQATIALPTADDLSETPEVQFTPEIRAKAQDELGCNPTKIYNWVRNNIDYEPYYGSFKNAGQTLLEGAGNDFDQASLLIGLMRVCNIAAKYSYGTVEIPAEKAANMVGVSDPRAAANILATQGIPAKMLIAGGTVKAIQMERVWVEAWIDYFPSWGARHKSGGEDTWIPLDPSFKQYTYKQGMDMYALMGFNADQFLQSYITDTRDITAYQDYSIRMISYLDANYPDASVEDVLGASEVKLTKTIVKQEFPYLLGTLPYKVIVRAAQFTEVPQSKDYMIIIQIAGDSLEGTTGLTYTGGLNELASKRVTVSYDPATSSDEALIAQYGGNIFSVPPYLLNVKPVLKINGAAAATGGPIVMGKDQTIVISFAGPDGDIDRIQNIITAGAYSAIILQSQNTPVTTPSKNMAALIENSKRVDSPDITLDDLLGQLLYSIGVSYFETLSYENEVFAKTLQLVTLRQPSEAMVTQGVKVDYLFGLPRTISAGGVNVDVDRNVNVVYSPAQDKEREKAFMILSGLASSVSENRILEAFFNVPSVSSVRLLKQASEQSIPIYTITSTNLNEILPSLQVDADVKADIINAVNAQKNVIVSKTKITYGRWIGVGYIISDAVTGAGSYMISGGLAGAGTDQAPIADPNFKVTWLDRLIFKIVRWNVISHAKDLVGTLYGFGCKNPDAVGSCKDKIDCSGLTSRSYTKAGIKLLGDGSAEFPYKNAQQQYDYSLQTEEPIFADLVFFQGTYDKNCDGMKDTADGITHVGIYIGSDLMIAAQRWYENGAERGVYYFPISSFGEQYPKACQLSICVAWDGGNNCTRCSCEKIFPEQPYWSNDPSKPTYNQFVGYGKIIP